jgi:hypothetical protein
MSMPTTPSFCFITPTYRGEIRQFAELRRSIGRFAPGVCHIAIVNTEDYAELTDRFPREAHLQIMTTADVLPRVIERHRRRATLTWFSGRWLRRRVIRSRHVQQLVRLYALASCAYEAAAFVDANVFITHPVEPGSFYVDGRLKLLRRRAVETESMDCDIATHEILGRPLHQVTELFDYRFSPACFRRSSAVRLLAELERRRPLRWIRRFIAQQRPSEYNLLGYAATALEGCAGYELIECGLSQSFLPSSCPATE